MAEIIKLLLTRPHVFRLRMLDEYLTQIQDQPQLQGWRRLIVEFVYFGLKEARACLFAGLFFAAVFIIPRSGVLGCTAL